VHVVAVVFLTFDLTVFQTKQSMKIKVTSKSCNF